MSKRCCRKGIIVSIFNIDSTYMSFIGVRLCIKRRILLHKRKDFVLLGCGTYFIEDSTIQYSVLCVFFPFILDIEFVGRTSRGYTGGRSHRIFHPPSFCGACLNFSREKDSAIPFPRRP